MGVDVPTHLDPLPFGKGEVRRTGTSGVAMLVFGTLLGEVLKAAEVLDATVVNMRWAKPLDTELLASVAQTHTALVTVEEGSLMGGAGSAVLEALQALGVYKPVLRLGLPDVFIDHGDPAKPVSYTHLDVYKRQTPGRRRWRC